MKRLLALCVVLCLGFVLGCGDDTTKKDPKKSGNGTKKIDPVKPDPVKPDPVKPDPVKPDPVKPDPVKPDPVKPDPVKPDPKKGGPDIGEPIDPIKKKDKE
jgi:hypothetical protein